MYNVERIPLDAPLVAKRVLVNANRMRITRLDAPVTLQIGENGEPFEVSRPGVIYDCDGMTVVLVTLDAANVVAGGILEFIASNTVDFDFLAESGGSESGWEPVAILMHDPGSGSGFNVLDPNAGVGNNYGTSAGITADNDMVNQRVGALLATGATLDGRFFRTGRPYNALLNYLFAPAMLHGVGRNKKFLPSFRFESDLEIEISGLTGEILFFMGLGAHVAGTETMGAGVFVSPNALGNNNAWLGVVDYSGGFVGAKPRVVDRVVMQDTGIAVVNKFVTLAFEIGQRDGIPYMAAEIDGSRSEYTGEWPAFPDFWIANAMSEGMRIARTVAGDVGRVHMAEYRVFAKTVKPE